MKLKSHIITIGTFVISSSCFAKDDTLPSYNMPNLLGIGVGTTPDFHGSSDSLLGAVPGARISLDNHRYAEWYGPYAALKINTEKNFEYGPAILFKLGREDVDNDYVNQLDSIDHGAEIGGFIGYSFINTDYAIPFRYRIGALASTKLIGGTQGSNVNLYNSVWIPLSRDTFFGSGAGLTWADGRYMRNQFNVSAAESERSGISEFSASGGLRQSYAWVGVVHKFHHNWAIGSGAYVQSLKNDAKNSSIVQEQGDKTQFTYGIGLGYFFN